SRIYRGVVETRTHFRAFAVAEEVHHVSFAPKIAFEDAPAQFLVHEIKQFDGACMHRDRPRLTARTRHPFDASIFDAPARELDRQSAPHCTATDDQYGDFTDVRHTWLGRKHRDTIQPRMAADDADKRVVRVIRAIRGSIVSVCFVITVETN